MNVSPTRVFSSQLAEVAALAALSLLLGFALNRLSGRPLVLTYQTPEQRLVRQLGELVKNPPFKLMGSQTLGLDQFRRVLAEQRPLVLDARAASFYREGHIPGAFNLSRENFGSDYQRLSATLGAARDRPIVVYCSGGSCHDSKLVAGALLSLGFANVRVFTGGWEAWQDARLPVSR